MFLIFQKELADSEHQDKGGQHYGESGYARTQYAHACAVLLGYRSIAYIGCRVDTDGTGRHLTDSHDVRKLLRRQPTVAGDHLALYHGKHGVSAAKTEKPDFKECIE